MKLRIEVRTPDKRETVVPRIYEFAEGPVNAGRSSSGHVVLDEQPISRLQLVFADVHGAWHVTHRGSAVATILNRETLPVDRPTRLAEGDSIRVGSFELRIGIVQVSELPELRPLSEFRSATMMPTIHPDAPASSAGTFVALPADDARGARPGPAGRGVPTLIDPSAAPGTGRLEFTEVGRSYTIGRASTCDMPLSNSSVSRQHALARFDGKTVYVKDAGSRNPVRVNGRPILGETPLAPGDTVGVGPVDLNFVVDQGGVRPAAAPLDPLRTIDMDARGAAKAPAPSFAARPPSSAGWSPAPPGPAPSIPPSAAGGWRPDPAPGPAWSPPPPAAAAPAPAPQPFFDAPVRPAQARQAPSWDMPSAAPAPAAPQAQWETPSQAPVWTPPPIDAPPPPPAGRAAAAPQPPAPAQPPSPAPTSTSSSATEVRAAPRRGSRRSGWLVAGIVCMSCAVVGGIVLMLVSL